jgi:magnesium-transporting ATPase (P-type)
MSDEQNPPPPVAPLKEVERRKRIWPWMLLQFLPAVVLTFFFLLVLGFNSQRRFSVPPQIICGIVISYCYVLSFFFYRSRGKSILFSLLVSVGTALIVFAANAILIVGIVFVGCLVALGGHGKW